MKISESQQRAIDNIFKQTMLAGERTPVSLTTRHFNDSPVVMHRATYESLRRLGLIQSYADRQHTSWLTYKGLNRVSKTTLKGTVKALFDLWGGRDLIGIFLPHAIKYGHSHAIKRALTLHAVAMGIVRFKEPENFYLDVQIDPCLDLSALTKEEKQP